jgi:hypothetical protein
VFERDGIRDLYGRLAPLLAKGSLIYEIRNRHGSHCPNSLSLAQLPGIAPEDLALFATRYDGNTFALISTLCAAGSLVHVSHDQTVQEALGSVIDKLVSAFDAYCALLIAILFSLIKCDIKAHSRQTVISNDGACTLADIQLRFFCSPSTDID